MHWLDYAVLLVYFAAMGGIGLWSMRRVKVQEDYFMGGRSFGKLLQTFAAFGAGTGSSDPVNTGRTTFTSGMSGMWSVMYWLFVTPFYWIAGVWYRRMRHLTLGDWFHERYESKPLAAAYAIFGIVFYIVYGSMLFSAIGKVAAPLVGAEAVQWGSRTIGIEYILVPLIGVVVLVYGILGGLRAAYFTDLIQGMCIIVLSVLLVPFGLRMLVDQYAANPEQHGMLYGFNILHEQLPPEYFHVVGSSSTTEFTFWRILAVVIINLVGIVVQPHFIATGGGSAKTESSARIGLVLGNFLKRFCTVGWVLTALIALALFADSPELIQDPDRTWGVASRELLGPGLTGLMLACLLAALMSSVDAYMIVGSGLIVRNLYAPYVRPALFGSSESSEREFVQCARLTGVLIVGGAVIVSLWYMDVFTQLKLTWIIPVVFAAPFWIGMYWRRATTAGAWGTIAFSLLAFFFIPWLMPLISPGLRTSDQFLDMNQWVRTTTLRTAAPSDVAKQRAKIALFDQQQDKIDVELQDANSKLGTADAARAVELQVRVEQLTEQQSRLGARPNPIVSGDEITDVVESRGKSVFWEGDVKPVDEAGNVRDDVSPQPVGPPEQIDENTKRVVLSYADDVQLMGFGNFKLDNLLYKLCGMDFAEKSNANLDALSLPPKIIAPFLVMILVSLVTKTNSKQALDRYYSKMKTPVRPDPAEDQRALEEAYAAPELCEQKKLFPGSSLEFQRPNWVDVVGFVACFAACFAIIGLAVWLGSIGS